MTHGGDVTEIRDRFVQAAAAIRNASALVITAGAGMGVDSGLPDFRGDKGFWQAYPPYERLGLSFVQAANPAHFERNPRFGWGFYGHRTNLYRETAPHRGFALLQEWIRKIGLEAFVVTSNVDGQFQKAGFPDEEILEVHGSIHYLQCTEPCSLGIWPNGEEIAVDTATMLASSVPRCIRCGGVARPNILMFGDYSWVDERTRRQEEQFRLFLERRRGNLTVIEIGAGTAIPTIRSMGERLAQRKGDSLIRINPREWWVGDAEEISLPCGALEGISGIDREL